MIRLEPAFRATTMLFGWDYIRYPDMPSRWWLLVWFGPFRVMVYRRPDPRAALLARDLNRIAPEIPSYTTIQRSADTAHSESP